MERRRLKIPFTRQTLIIVFICVIVLTMAYGIFAWTRTLKLRRAERVVREAIELVVAEKGEAGLMEIVGAFDNYSTTGTGGVLPILGYDDSRFTTNELQNIDVYERYNKAVVNITTQRYQYNFFLEAVPESGTGSGLIIDDQGHILTNYHVVEGVDEVYVSLHDGTSYTGTIIGKDRENDLAVVKVDFEKGRSITKVEFGTSANLKVGQKVLAIGNPFGYDRTLTTGIVSGLGRPVKTDEGLIILDMIQTDASINPGNSGGPLLDSQGFVIGINSSIYTTTGASVGIGFAVPIDNVKRVIAELIDHGKVVRGWIDIIPVQLDSRIISYAGLTVQGGLLVSRVTEGGKAEQAGMKGGKEKVKYGNSIIYLGGDIIIKADGVVIKDYADLFSALEDNKPGDIVEIVVLRSAHEVALQVELTARPEQYEWN